MQACISAKVAMLGAAETGKTHLMRHWIFHNQQPQGGAYVCTRGIIYHHHLSFTLPSGGDTAETEVTIAPEEIGSGLHREHLEKRPPVQAAAFLLFFNSRKRSTYVTMWTLWWKRAVEWILTAQGTPLRRRPFIVFCDTAAHASEEKCQEARRWIEADILKVMPEHSYLFFSIDVLGATESDVTNMWKRVARQLIVQHEAEIKDTRARTSRPNFSTLSFRWSSSRSNSRSRNNGERDKEEEKEEHND